MSAINPKDCFLQTKVADLRLICCPGAEELTNLIDNHLVRWANEAGIDKETFIIPAECPRFQSGDAKGLVKESVSTLSWTRATTASPIICSAMRTISPRMTILQTSSVSSRLWQARHTACPSSCPACTAAVSTAVWSARAWTAPWPCRSCRPWA